MYLAVYFFITIVIELPILVLFFKRKKRQSALVTGLLLNLTTWSIFHIFRISTDINLNYVEVGIVVFEALGYILFLELSWKRAFIISIVTNGLSFMATRKIRPEADMFQSKPGIINSAVVKRREFLKF